MSDITRAEVCIVACAEAFRGEGATVVFIGVDGRLAGLMAIADPIKATTPAALAALKEAGIRVVMLTGDNKATAQAVAEARHRREELERGKARAALPSMAQLEPAAPPEPHREFGRIAAGIFFGLPDLNY